MMIYTLFSILFFSLASAECPPGYVDGGSESSYCYMISPAKLTWAAGQEVRFNKILINFMLWRQVLLKLNMIDSVLLESRRQTSWDLRLWWRIKPELSPVSWSLILAGSIWLWCWGWLEVGGHSSGSPLLKLVHLSAWQWSPQQQGSRELSRQGVQTLQQSVEWFLVQWICEQSKYPRSVSENQEKQILKLFYLKQ